MKLTCILWLSGKRFDVTVDPGTTVQTFQGLLQGGVPSTTTVTATTAAAVSSSSSTSSPPPQPPLGRIDIVLIRGASSTKKGGETTTTATVTRGPYFPLPSEAFADGDVLFLFHDARNNEDDVVQHLSKTTAVAFSSENGLSAKIIERQRQAVDLLSLPLEEHRNLCQTEFVGYERTLSDLLHIIGRKKEEAERARDALKTIRLVENADKSLHDKVPQELVERKLEQGERLLQHEKQRAQKLAQRLKEELENIEAESRARIFGHDAGSMTVDDLRTSLESNQKFLHEKMTRVKTRLKSVQEIRSQVVRGSQQLAAVREKAIDGCLNVVINLPEAYREAVEIAQDRLILYRAANRVRNSLLPHKKLVQDKVAAFTEKRGRTFPSNIIPGICDVVNIGSPPEDVAANFLDHHFPDVDEDRASLLLAKCGLAPSEPTAVSSDTSNEQQLQLQQQQKLLCDEQQQNIAALEAELGEYRQRVTDRDAEALEMRSQLAAARSSVEDVLAAAKRQTDATAEEEEKRKKEKARESESEGDEITSLKKQLLVAIDEAQSMRKTIELLQEDNQRAAKLQSEVDELREQLSRVQIGKLLQRQVLDGVFNFDMTRDDESDEHVVFVSTQGATLKLDKDTTVKLRSHTRKRKLQNGEVREYLPCRVISAEEIDDNIFLCSATLEQGQGV